MLKHGLLLVLSLALSLVLVASQTCRIPAILRLRIAAEASSLQAHPFAGTYQVGALLRLDLAPRAGFVLERRAGCLPFPMTLDGVVIVDGGRLRLEPRLPGGRGLLDPLAGEILPLELGGRRYLVPVARVTEFCNAVNSGYEPSSVGVFPIRRGGGASTARQEELPPEVSRCLLAKPLWSRIVSVGDVQGHGPGESLPGATWKLQTGWGTLPVVLDVGAQDGVWVGMKFYAARPPCSYQPAEVTRVEEGTSEAVFAAEWLAATPEPGWLLSTRAGDWPGLQRMPSRVAEE